MTQGFLDILRFRRNPQVSHDNYDGIAGYRLSAGNDRAAPVTWPGLLSFARLSWRRLCQREQISDFHRRRWPGSRLPFLVMTPSSRLSQPDSRDERLIS